MSGLSGQYVLVARLHYECKILQEIPIKEARKAEILLLGGHIADAESTLVQSGLYFR